MKKFRSRKIANGSPNAVWKRIETWDRVEEPEVVVQREDRDQRHLDRDDEQRNDDDEQPVAPRELEPGKGIGRKRRQAMGRIVAPSEIQSVVKSDDVIASLSRMSR